MISSTLGVAVLAAAVTSAGAAWHFTSQHYELRLARGALEYAEAVAAVASSAREQERAQQEKINASLKQQAGALARINDGLRADLDGLRNRPGRADGVSDAARVACAGGTGAELSGPDAVFLAGEAARADALRAGLEACYAALEAGQTR